MNINTIPVSYGLGQQNKTSFKAAYLDKKSFKIINQMIGDSSLQKDSFKKGVSELEEFAKGFDIYVKENDVVLEITSKLPYKCENEEKFCECFSSTYINKNDDLLNTIRNAIEYHKKIRKFENDWLRFRQDAHIL